MNTNSKNVYFSVVNGSQVCLFDIYSDKVLKVINVPSGIKSNELIINMFAIPAAAELMDVSAVVYKRDYMPCFIEYMDGVVKNVADMVA